MKQQTFWKCGTDSIRSFLLQIYFGTAAAALGQVGWSLSSLTVIPVIENEENKFEKDANYYDMFKFELIYFVQNVFVG